MQPIFSAARYYAYDQVNCDVIESGYGIVANAKGSLEGVEGWLVGWNDGCSTGGESGCATGLGQ